VHLVGLVMEASLNIFTIAQLHVYCKCGDLTTVAVLVYFFMFLNKGLMMVSISRNTLPVLS